MTAREIAGALLADKAPQATWRQAIDLQAAILAALRKRDGAMVIDAGVPVRWRRRPGVRGPPQFVASFNPAMFTHDLVVSVNLAGESQPAASEMFQSIGFSLTLR
jgi:hypothetical protein